MKRLSILALPYPIDNDGNAFNDYSHLLQIRATNDNLEDGVMPEYAERYLAYSPETHSLIVIEDEKLPCIFRNIAFQSAKGALYDTTNGQAGELKGVRLIGETAKQ